MTILHLGHRALRICAAVVILAGCSGPQTLIGDGGMPQGPAATRPDRAGSWILPEASGENLLYVSERVGRGKVRVFSYPQGKLVGTLTGLSYPEGLCVDASGDIFVANYSKGNVLEYAHGGTSPIATLTDPGYIPMSCSVDPTTGNLAVTEFDPKSRQFEIAVYAGAQGNPTHFKEASVARYLYCAYDSKGNLFLDGYRYQHNRPVFALAELPNGGNAFEGILLKPRIAYSSDVQWDGKYLTIGGGFNVIYQYKFVRGGGMEVGSTTLNGESGVSDFWIQGSTVIVPTEIGTSSNKYTVKLFRYPSGGSATKTIHGLMLAAGVTVSLAPKR